ncbi:MAG: hypothetical protein WBY93_21025 [Candidatus Binatus sp.]
MSIGLPRPDPRSKDGGWECTFLIEGVVKSKLQTAFGVDSLQALMQAIECVRVGLEQTGRNLFWLDPKVGTDIPMTVPTIWGNQVVERVRLAIEREILRVWRATINSRKAKVRAQEAELKRQGKAPSEIAKALAEKKAFHEQWQARVDKLKPGWSIPLPSGKHTKRKPQNSSR